MKAGGERVTPRPRSGALAALVDEYERALGSLGALLGTIPDPAFALTRDRDTRDADCRSVQTVIAHVTSSGYGYADMIRSVIGADSTRPRQASARARRASTILPR
jgi:hypothetical protein